MTNSLRFPSILVAAPLLACLAANAAAQYGQPAPQPQSPPPSQPAAPAAVPEADFFNPSADSLTVLVAYRNADEVQRDLNAAMGEQAMAAQKYERAKLLAALAETRIKLKAVEITSLDAQIDLAKTEKNELKRRDFEARKRLAESQKQLLERRRDLRDREIAVAKALKEYHEASAKVNQLELELGAKRQQRVGFGGTVSPEVAAEFQRLQAEITSLEEKVLNAQIEEANKWKSVAAQEAQLVKIRKAVFQSQTKVAREGS